jgi:hypothetical protein
MKNQTILEINPEKENVVWAIETKFPKKNGWAKTRQIARAYRKQLANEGILAKIIRREYKLNLVSEKVVQ